MNKNCWSGILIILVGLVFLVLPNKVNAQCGTANEPCSCTSSCNSQPENCNPNLNDCPNNCVHATDPGCGSGGGACSSGQTKWCVWDPAVCKCCTSATQTLKVTYVLRIACKKNGEWSATAENICKPGFRTGNNQIVLSPTQDCGVRKQYECGVLSCVQICTLSTPSNIRYSDGILYWDSAVRGTGQILVVTNALGATIVNGYIDKNALSYQFSPALTAGTTYNVQITNTDAFCRKDGYSSFSTPALINTVAWWQVKDGDITANGNIISPVPSGQLFNIVGSGGFPGVPVYSGSLAVTPGAISTKRWNANTNTIQERLFDYSYFENLIPGDVVSGEIYSDDYEWTKVTGDYSLPATNFGSRKVILFVDGNLTINGNINLNDGLGFFGTFVKGNIIVNPIVTGTPTLEGIYLSNGNFSTGPGTTQLHIRGSVVSYGGVVLQRTFANNTIPAELFEFAPDQIMLFPEKLGFRGQKWMEVAP